MLSFTYSYFRFFFFCFPIWQGGADQCLPVLVSRVAPNTPADLCSPKLTEGDQVLSVNGISVDCLTHEQVRNRHDFILRINVIIIVLTFLDKLIVFLFSRYNQVVQLIRCSKDRSAGGELTLVIRPNRKLPFAFISCHFITFHRNCDYLLRYLFASLITLTSSCF